MLEVSLIILISFFKLYFPVETLYIFSFEKALTANYCRSLMRAT